MNHGLSGDKPRDPRAAGIKRKRSPMLLSMKRTTRPRIKGWQNAGTLEARQHLAGRQEARAQKNLSHARDASPLTTALETVSATKVPLPRCVLNAGADSISGTNAGPNKKLGHGKNPWTTRGCRIFAKAVSSK